RRGSVAQLAEIVSAPAVGGAIRRRTTRALIPGDDLLELVSAEHGGVRDQAIGTGDPGAELAVHVVSPAVHRARVREPASHLIADGKAAKLQLGRDRLGRPGHEELVPGTD